MRFTLRTLFLAPVVMAAAALATNTAMAESTTLKVPFSFTVAGKICPAGYYSVQRHLTQSLVTLQSKDGRNTFTWTLSPGDAAPTDTAVKLKFNEVGDTHVLRAVQYGPLETFKLGESKHPEHSLAMRGQGR
jgi:hypothetical protein